MLEEYEAAQAPPQSKASMPTVYHDEVPTEPATSPRSQVVEVPVHPTYIEELRLPSREFGPHPEPEKFATRWVSRDGYTQEEWEAYYFRKHRQAWSSNDMERERQQAEAAEYEAHQRSIQEWEARVVLKPLTQSQQQGTDIHEEYKHKSRLVFCGNFATWGEHSTTTTNLDAPLLRLMLSLACSKETTWSSVDITSAFLNADIHDEDTVLITPPPILVKMDIVKPNTVWHVKKAIYGSREAPRLWQQERDQQLRELEFVYNDRSAHLVQSYIHPSLWFIAEGSTASTKGTPPFDHCLRSDEWTVNLHKHKILGYVGVYVDDLLIAGPRSLNDTLIKAVQGIWKTSAREHLGPDPDCVPILRFLGMNLERVDEERGIY